jgi:alkylhydroperoxidase/carboxymuconolactone decarboxylase family protein YurZ
MAQRPENPMKMLESMDPELYKVVESNRKFAYTDGVLPLKFKMLLTMALDASHGTVPGTMSCAMGAMQAGATKEEIMETLRVVGFVCGVGSVYTTIQALKQCIG